MKTKRKSKALNNIDNSIVAANDENQNTTVRTGLCYPNSFEFMDKLARYRDAEEEPVEKNMLSNPRLVHGNISNHLWNTSPI